jgi:carbonic anhydrase
MIPEARASLDRLLEGNRRFREGRSEHRRYKTDELAELAKQQHPIAAIVACADSRVSPDIIFDQPLGSIFASRVPGNVASDSAKWMLEIAVQEFRVPLVVVLGHTGCLAIGQLLDGDKGGPGGQLRSVVLSAVYEARSRRPEDLYLEAITVNAIQTVNHLKRDSYAVRRAIDEHRLELVPALYEMESGEVKLLDSSQQ